MTSVRTCTGWLIGEETKSREKNLEILSTTDGKKNSRLTAKISRILRFAQMKNLEIYVSRET